MYMVTKSVLLLHNGVSEKAKKIVVYPVPVTGTRGRVNRLPAANFPLQLTNTKTNTLILTATLTLTVKILKKKL